MAPTAELRWVEREYPAPFEGAGVIVKPVLQQKWVQHHIPYPETSAPFEWRDVPTVKEDSHGRQ